MSLYPTKTRLELLRDVADPTVRVWVSYIGNTYGESYVAAGRERRRKVTTRILELDREGWVRRGPVGDGPTSFARNWEITDAGRAVLDGGAA